MKKQKGFTLIELLVSLTLLSVVVVVVMGLVTTSNAKVRTTRSQRRVMDNVSFAIEHMSRSITYGHDYSCSSGSLISCNYQTGGTQVLNFKGNYLGGTANISYERNINTLTNRGYISRSINSGAGVSITDESIDIQELTFYVYHSEPYAFDPEQPRVTIFVKGVSYASSKPEEFFIQTTVSQRDLKL